MDDAGEEVQGSLHLVAVLLTSSLHQH